MHLFDLKDLVAQQVDEPSVLVDMLEISLDELMERFADKLLEHKEKFGVRDDDN